MENKLRELRDEEISAVAGGECCGDGGDGTVRGGSEGQGNPGTAGDNNPGPADGRV